MVISNMTVKNSFIAIGIVAGIAMSFLALSKASFFSSRKIDQQVNRNKQTTIIKKQLLTFNEVAAAGASNKYVGQIVSWKGVINHRLSQVNGLKMNIIDSEHRPGQWRESDWFWASDDGTTHSVEEVLQKYENDSPKVTPANETSKDTVEPLYDPSVPGYLKNVLFLVTGKLESNDCDNSAPSGKKYCIPNLDIQKIEKFN